MYLYRIKRDEYASGKEVFTVLRKLDGFDEGDWYPFASTYSNRAFALAAIEDHRVRSADRRLDKTTYEDVP